MAPKLRSLPANVTDRTLALWSCDDAGWQTDQRIAPMLAELRHCAWAGVSGLLLLFADAVSRSWKQVIYFKPEREAGAAPSPRPSQRVTQAPTTEVAGGGLPEGVELIQDERGVRIARNQDD